MAEIANITTKIDELRKPPYQIARTIDNIDTLHFANDRLQVRVTRKNGRAVGYEQQIRWADTGFTAFQGAPADFITTVPALVEALTGQAQNIYNDVTMRFQGQRFSEWDTQDTQVLIVEAWQPMTPEQVTAYKAIKTYQQEAARKRRTADRLEAQARQLRQPR